MSWLLSAICFVMTHAGPAEHAAVFKEGLEQRGHEVHIYADGPALEVLVRQGVMEGLYPLNNLEMDAVDWIVAREAGVSALVLDVSSFLSLELMERFERQSPSTLRVAYYDNPEPYVPGGYSLVASKVMGKASRVLFAYGYLEKVPLYEAPFVEVELALDRRFGIGYIPLDTAKALQEVRSKTKTRAKRQFLVDQGYEEDKKVFLYAGGNNRDYFERGFPFFLHLLSKAQEEGIDLSSWVILFQQHPGAKQDNVDGRRLQAWIEEHGSWDKAPSWVVSHCTTEEAEPFVDAILYTQTSMGVRWAIAGIPTFQVRSELYEDLLVRYGMAEWAVSLTPLLGGETRPKEGPSIEVLLGYRRDFLDRLERALVCP
jgi:hypothetical protein